MNLPEPPCEFASRYALDRMLSPLESGHLPFAGGTACNTKRIGCDGTPADFPSAARIWEFLSTLEPLPEAQRIVVQPPL